MKFFNVVFVLLLASVAMINASPIIGKLLLLKAAGEGLAKLLKGKNKCAPVSGGCCHDPVPDIPC